MSEISVRWIVKNDVGRVVEIERECFPKPWSEEDFSECLRRRQNIGKVVEVDGSIVGYILYELSHKKICLINMGVTKSSRRSGVGRFLVEHLKSKLEKPDYWLSIETRVSEENLEAHLFLKRCGFKALSVDRDFFTDEDGSCDGYLFAYTRGMACENELVESAEEIT